MRNADYIPVGQIPMIDLGAQYEAAKARREEAENRKLEYLSQFKRVRGPLTDGLKPEFKSAGILSRRCWKKEICHWKDARSFSNSIKTTLTSLHTV